MKFDLNDSQIGFALFFTALGLLISIPFVPYVNKKIGTGRSTKLGIIVFALLFNLPLITPSYFLLCASLLVIGVFSGFTDVSMNALVSNIEKKDKQNFMSAAHGFFSLGGFIGAGVGSVLITVFANPMYHMLLVSSLIIISNLILAKHYENNEESVEQLPLEKTNIYKNIRPILGLSIVAFIIMFNEGAVEHWSNLFLFDTVHVSESQAGLGFVVFSLTMTIGRFFGDGISSKMGPIKTISYGCIIAVFAYALILTSNFYSSILGFGILGLGLSVIIPEIFRLAGQTKGIHTSVAISVVSGIGFIGFLIGPVLLGLISSWSSLLMSYVFLLVLVLVAYFLVLFWIQRKYKTEKIN